MLSIRGSVGCPAAAGALECAAIIEFSYGDLARQPRRVGRPLQRELEGLWGARHGPYRILYEIHDERLTVLVIHVDHRTDVYRSR